MPNKPQHEAGEDAASQLINLAEAAKVSGLSQAHLRRLAINGSIWATKLGRDWLTTPQAIKEYLATNPRPGPKSKKE